MWFADSNFVNMCAGLQQGRKRGAAEHLHHRDGGSLLDHGRRSTPTTCSPPATTGRSGTSSTARPGCSSASPAVDAGMARASPTSRSCRFWPRRWALGEFWNKTDEEWVRSFVNAEHPAWDGFDFDKAVEEGIWAPHADGIFDSQIVFCPDGVFPTPSTKFTALQRRPGALPGRGALLQAHAGGPERAGWARSTRWCSCSTTTA